MWSGTGRAEKLAYALPLSFLLLSIVTRSMNNQRPITEPAGISGVAEHAYGKEPVLPVGRGSVDCDSLSSPLELNEESQRSIGFDEHLASEVAGKAAQQSVRRSATVRKLNWTSGEGVYDVQETYFSLRRKKKKRGSILPRVGGSQSQAAIGTFGVAHDHAETCTESTPSSPTTSTTCGIGVSGDVDSVTAELTELAQRADKTASLRRTLSRKASMHKKIHTSRERRDSSDPPANEPAKTRAVPPSPGLDTVNLRAHVSRDVVPIEEDQEDYEQTVTTLLALTEANLAAIGQLENAPEPTSVDDCKTGDSDVNEASESEQSREQIPSQPTETLLPQAVDEVSEVPKPPPLPASDGQYSDNEVDHGTSAPSATMPTQRTESCVQKISGNRSVGDDALAVIAGLEAEKTELEYLVESLRDQMEYLEADLDDSKALALQKKNEVVRLTREHSKLEEKVVEMRGQLLVRETVLRENGITLPASSPTDQATLEEVLATARRLFENALAKRTIDSSAYAMCQQEKEGRTALDSLTDRLRSQEAQVDAIRKEKELLEAELKALQLSSFSKPSPVHATTADVQVLLSAVEQERDEARLGAYKSSAECSRLAGVVAFLEKDLAHFRGEENILRPLTAEICHLSESLLRWNQPSPLEVSDVAKEHQTDADLAAEVEALKRELQIMKADRSAEKARWEKKMLALKNLNASLGELLQVQREELESPVVEQCRSDASRVHLPLRTRTSLEC